MYFVFPRKLAEIGIRERLNQVSSLQCPKSSMKLLRKEENNGSEKPRKGQPPPLAQKSRPCVSGVEGESACIKRITFQLCLGNSDCSGKKAKVRDD